MTDQAPGTPGQGTSALLAAPQAPEGAQAPPAAGTPPSPGTPPSAGPIPWLPEVDETTAGYVQNKGWDSPVKMLDSYRNLEKLMGADKAGNTVVLPKPDATPEEMGKFYERLGRPADPTGYKLSVPDGADPAFAQAAAAKMHELGLPQKQGEALAAWWNEQVGTAQAGAKVQTEQAYQADDLALKATWGAAFQQNLAIAQAAYRGLGLDPATVDKLQGAMGHKATMEFLHKIGSKTGEADFVTGSGKEPFGSALTPGQAKSKIDELRRDKAFVSRLASGNAEAVAEMTRLHSFAHPGEE